MALIIADSFLRMACAMERTSHPWHVELESKLDESTQFGLENVLVYVKPLP